MTERRRLVVRDGPRELHFTGALLSQSSSFRPSKDRWVEFEIYRTDSGKFVIARVGRTIVDGENDRYWARVSDTAEGVIETLYLEDADGVRYLTNVTQRLLEEAARNDEDIKRAFLVEFVN